MIKRFRIAFICAVIASVTSVSEVASARVFDFKNEFFSIYFGGSFGTTAVGDGPYASASAVPTTFDKKVSTATSAEGGFSLAFSRIALRVGIDYIMPRTQTGIIATNSSGTKLYDLTSDVSAFSYMGNLEFIAYRSTSSRAIFGGGYGISTVSLSNEYTMTTAGQTLFNIGGYTEKASGMAPVMQGYVGYEVLFTDTATATIQAGYRYLIVTELKANQDATSISGQEKNGQKITNYDGSDRSLNLSGGFVGIVFRFYL